MVLALLLSLSLAAAPSVTGVVKDSSGGAVSGAAVLLQTSAGVQQQTVTGPDGRFSFDNPPSDSVTLIVRAGGFGEVQKPVNGAAELEITLSPANLLETVIVTPSKTEQRLGDTPASVSLLTTREIESSPAVMADDVLRQVPSFSLFRRANSISAQPTTQGVSLRGIGPSGQSRTLVLLDGIPFNDPFGGWVYWTRVPLISVDRIEVTEDTASSLYGNYAMGGVINIVTTRPTPHTVEFKPQYGNYGSPKADIFASDAWNKFAVGFEGTYFRTDGFPIVTDERGPIDINANVKYGNTGAKAEYNPTNSVRLFGRVGHFEENRVNGKVDEINSTNWNSGSGGALIRLPDASELQSRVFVDRQKAHYTFMAVNTAVTRQTVRLATDQHVPVNGLGGMVQWQKAIGTTNAFSVGADWRKVDGDSQEDAYVAAAPVAFDGLVQRGTLSVQRVTGGSQLSQGLFVQDILTPTSKAVFTLNVRLDHWKNYDGHFNETAVATGLPTVNNKPTLPDKTDTVVSPRVGVLYHLTNEVTVWGAMNSGFRAPTLTELYRQFSVGALVTRPNDQLNPERLVGGELGVSTAPIKNLTARLTYFDNRIKNPVFNVTITPGTLAQKQNIPKTRIYGAQTDVQYVLTKDLSVSAAYLYDVGKVTEGAGLTSNLTDKFIAQVPKNRGSIDLVYSNLKYARVSFGVQWIGFQYDDDLNARGIPALGCPVTSAANSPSLNCIGIGTPGLPGYHTIDFSASREVVRNFEVFFGVQNIANTVYYVQTNPSTVGTPRLVTGGVRVKWAGR
jgi:outer membrane receptor protein involved in Fe transport